MGTSWVWQELAEKHTWRSLYTRRCLVQFAGFIADRLHGAKKALKKIADRKLEDQKEKEKEKKAEAEDGNSTAATTNTTDQNKNKNKPKNKNKNKKKEAKKESVADLRRQCSKYLYHALHKLETMKTVLNGEMPSVWLVDDAPARQHIMTVRHCAPELDLQKEWEDAEEVCNVRALCESKSALLFGHCSRSL